MVHSCRMLLLAVVVVAVVDDDDILDTLVGSSTTM